MAPEAVQLRFRTKSGILTADLRDDGIELDFPSLRAKKIKATAKLQKALGAKPKAVVKVARRYIGRALIGGGRPQADDQI